MSSSKFTIAAARDHFPALKRNENNQVFFDNAGGSQVLGEVVESISEYLSNNNVQLGASYTVGQKSTARYADGYAAASKFINASPAEIVVGGSTTQLFRNLSYAIKFSPGDEIVLSKMDHAANVTAWVQIAERLNLAVKWWKPSLAAGATNPKLNVDDLEPLLSARTKMVACTHVSNILGTINDIKSIAKKVHSIPGALFCVDAVAFAPHRMIDVKDLDVDFYAFSWYKVYGPHIALLYARESIQSQLYSLGHQFNSSATLEGKIGLAASSYELTQAIPEVLKYFGDDLRGSWDLVAKHEEGLSKVLLDYLRSKKDVTIYGEPLANAELRVPTIAFTVKGRSSREVVERVEQLTKEEGKGPQYGFRWGHFYSKDLINEVLGLDDEGVIRVSMVHYNTLDEIKEYVEKLQLVLQKW